MLRSQLATTYCFGLARLIDTDGHGRTQTHGPRACRRRHARIDGRTHAHEQTRTRTHMHTNTPDTDTQMDTNRMTAKANSTTNFMSGCMKQANLQQGRVSRWGNEQRDGKRQLQQRKNKGKAKHQSPRPGQQRKSYSQQRLSELLKERKKRKTLRKRGGQSRRTSQLENHEKNLRENKHTRASKARQPSLLDMQKERLGVGPHVTSPTDWTCFPSPNEEKTAKNGTKREIAALCHVGACRKHFPKRQ